MMSRNASGFTLIELVTVVAVVAILALIAIPSYQDQMRKSRRAEAITALQDQQLQQERYRVDHAEYASDGVLAFPNASAYTLKVDSASLTGFVLTATPESGQDKDSCGTLKLISDNGAIKKEPATSGCW